MTRKSGPAAALIALASLAGFGVAAYFALLHAPTDLAPVNQPNLAFPLPYVDFALVGAFVVWRRPFHRVGWVMGGIGVSMCSGLALLGIGRTLDRLPGIDGVVGAGVYLTGETLTTLAFSLVLVLLLVFPNGGFAGRFWKALFWLAILIPVIVALATIFEKPVLTGDETVLNPFHMSLPAELSALLDGLESFATYGLFLLIAALSPLVRFRRADPETRLQIKWFAFAVVAAAGFTLVDGLVQALMPSEPALDYIATVLYSVAWMAAIAAIGLAILRYKLWAIDLVISRTLTYVALVALLALLYVGLMVLVGTTLGQTAGVPIAVAATAAVALALEPARARLQRLANRIVFGQRTSPYGALADFSDRVAHTLTGDQVAPRMAHVLAEVTLAAQSAVWLDQGGRMELAGTWPPERQPGAEPAARTTEVRHDGRTLGLIAVWRRPGETLSAIEQRLMDDLARQAGVVLRGVALEKELLRSLDELRASRRRLVETQGRERRRLERDLHDGAQQQLVALSVSLGLEAQVALEAGQAARLEGLRCEVVAALETLRELSRGLAPPLLESEGLGGALSALARRVPLQVEVRANGERFRREAEAAVYFCCAEALQNVTKHACASRASVSISLVDGHLQFEVNDDGDGFDPVVAAGGTGLQNMRDRLEALGGQLSVQSGEGGTRVSGSVPC